MKIVVCCLLTLLWSLPLSAEIYKIKDKDGNVIYTDSPELIDQPDQTREVVELGPVNTQPAVEPQLGFEATPEEEEEQQISYVIDLVSPRDEAQVPPGQRNLQVAVRLEPQLQEDHRIQFIMDGEPLAPPSRKRSYLIEEIFRGTHTISAQVVNEQGQVLATTPTATVYVHRPSVLTRP